MAPVPGFFSVRTKKFWYETVYPFKVLGTVVRTVVRYQGCTVPGRPGVAKSHDEVTFYHFVCTYYTALLTYPREIKNSENTSAHDESGPVLTKGLPPFL